MDNNDLTVMFAHLSIHGWRPAQAMVKKYGMYPIVHNGERWYLAAGAMAMTGMMDQLAHHRDVEWATWSSEPNPKFIAKLIEAIADFEGGEDG